MHAVYEQIFQFELNESGRRITQSFDSRTAVFVDGTIDGALKLKQTTKQKEDA